MSPPTPNEAEDYGFIERQLALVGDDEPLEVLAATADHLERLAASHPDDDAWRRRPDEAAWSPWQILAHLADTEWVFGHRSRVILFEAEPTLAPVTQDRWVGLQAVEARAVGAWVKQFRHLRRHNLALWSRLGPDELARAAPHTGAGRPMSMAFLLRLAAGHDRSHLGQIEGRLAG